MSLTTSEMTPADLAAVTGGGEGFGGNSAWWIIILFLFAFCGGMNGNGMFGNGNSGAAENYVLASDFATLQRQIDTAADGLRQQSTQISNGLCDGFYAQNTTMLNGFAGMNNAISTNGYETRNAIQSAQIGQMQSTNAIQSQMAQCCCDTREAISGINYNMANSTRDIIENQNANSRAILDALNAQQTEALKARISDQNQQIFGLQLAASQCAQNAYLVNAIRPSPVPSYAVPSPYGTSGCGCGCGV